MEGPMLGEWMLVGKRNLTIPNQKINRRETEEKWRCMM
jgi:hypothetical protein